LQRLALALWLAGCGGPANLVLVSVDTLRPDHLPSYGYARETSAAIERLAREGVLWENAYATSPATVASHASLFTGRFPHQHLALHYGTPLAEPELTLAEILRQAGWRTFGVATSVRFHAGSGFAQGFERFETLEALPKNARSRAATDRVLELAAQRDGRPFFAFVHYFGPHAPYEPPEPWRSRFQSGPPALAPGGSGAYVNANREPGAPVSPEALAYLEALYDAEILYLDRDLARLLDGLDALGIADDTLLVLVSDHGEEFREHGGLSHARTLYEESLRIPLLMRWPGVLPAGRRVARPAQLVDVLPTVLELLGLAAPPPVAGRSLASDWRTGAGGGPDPVIGQRGPGQWSVAATLPEGRWKALFAQGSPAQLYDLDADPREQRDLGAARPDTVESLAAAGPPALREGFAAPQAVPVPEELVRQLVELGYAEEVGRAGAPPPPPAQGTP
jgi:arylsulfatase A-like enzyme